MLGGLVDIDQAGNLRPTAKRSPDPQNPWNQVRSKIHDAALQHSREELKKRWEELEWEYKSMDPASRLKQCVMPTLSGSSERTSFAVLQEQYAIWNKLSHAIERESLSDLKQALEQASNIDLSDSSRAILLLYCDVLTRQKMSYRFSTDQIISALDGREFESALDMVIDMATTQGANVGLLLTWLTRLCADWNAGCPPAAPPVAKAPGAVLASMDYEIDEFEDNEMPRISNARMSEALGYDTLVGMLQGKALKNSRSELNKAWNQLDESYASSAMDPSKRAAQGGVGIDYNPFTREEEIFYIRNKLVYAVHQQSLLELRRALSYALAFGLDPKSVEIEAAYRDALAKYQQADGFSSNHVRDALERCDWWTALDIIVSASLSKGADKCALQRVIGTFQGRQAQFVTVSPDAPQGITEASL